MSSLRDAAFDRAHDAIRKFFDGTDTYPFTSTQVTAAVIDVLMPEIKDPKDFKGVPEGSILAVPVMGGYSAMVVIDGLLSGRIKADGMPVDIAWILARYGPVTVVAMP